MAEGQVLFTLDYERFNEILSQQNWFNLQHEFGTAGVSLSHSFLIWKGKSGNTWLLADFETKKTYDIKRVIERVAESIERIAESEELAKVEISGPSNQEEQPIELTDTSSLSTLNLRVGS